MCVYQSLVSGGDLHTMVRSLKRAREHAGLTQAQLAQRLRIEQPTLSRYERGKQVPSPPVMRRLIRWSKRAVRPDHFFGLA
jgi:transcriptional regulator with XRE-family HTH domain